MSEQLLLVAYGSAVVLVALVATVRVWVGLSRVARRRGARVDRRKRFDAVHTSTPLDDPGSTARERAHDSIDAQFTVTRRVVIPAIAMAALVALALPFLDLVPAAGLSMVIAGVMLVAGIAARPFISNAIAGLVLSYSRLLSIGDTVKFGELYGTVEDITTTHTTIKLWDWRRYVIPNAEALSTSFVNYSLFDLYVWSSVEFFVAYDAELDTVRALALDAARASDHFAEHENPKFWVLELEPTGVRCMVAAWADTPGDAWSLTSDIRTSLVAAFQEGNIRSQMVQRIEGSALAAM